jgi:hypothetical protein
LTFSLPVNDRYRDLYRQLTERDLRETKEVEMIARPGERCAPTQGKDKDEERESPEHEASSHSDSQMLLWPATEYRPIASKSAPATMVMLNKIFLSQSGELGWPTGRRPRGMSK